MTNLVEFVKSRKIVYPNGEKMKNSTSIRLFNRF